MKTIAVILAGGSGSRIGGELPKQFISVAGRTVVERTIAAFDRHPLIDEIAIVCRADSLERMQDIVNRAGFTKVAHILTGGKERYHSTLAAIEAYAPQSETSATPLSTDTQDFALLIHDAVRPFVTERIITDCVQALEHHAAVEVAVETTDTIVELDENGNIARIPQRRLLRNAQTPQCFHLTILQQAFAHALRDPQFFPTDDISVVHRYLPNIPIIVIPGDPKNIKITYKEDLMALGEGAS